MGLLPIAVFLSTSSRTIRMPCADQARLCDVLHQRGGERTVLAVAVGCGGARLEGERNRCSGWPARSLESRARFRTTRSSISSCRRTVVTAGVEDHQPQLPRRLDVTRMRSGETPRQNAMSRSSTASTGSNNWCRRPRCHGRHNRPQPSRPGRGQSRSTRAGCLEIAARLTISKPAPCNVSGHRTSLAGLLSRATF